MSSRTTKPSEFAIEARGLSKTYFNVRLGAAQTSLRESFTKILHHPLRIMGIGAEHDPRADVRALQPISFQVKAGERLGLLGRNGSGKSTLMKILTRITPPTEGEAVMTGRTAAILEVGTGFHPELTGAENVYLNGAILGLRKAFIKERYQDIVAFSELEEFMDLPVKRYSSGMYVRLAFAVAAHLDADIMLIDEVLAVGDEAFQEKCLARMDALAAAGRTVVLISHDMRVVEKFCTRCLLLDHGKLVLDGPTKEAIEGYHRLCHVH